MDNKNYLTEESVVLPKKAKYEIYFPTNLNKRSVDEYLLLIGSEKNINWLEKYTKIEDLKKESLENISTISEEMTLKVIEQISGEPMNQSSIKATVQESVKKNIGKYL